MSSENNKSTMKDMKDKTSNQSHQTNNEKNNIHHKSDKVQTDKEKKIAVK